MRGSGNGSCGHALLRLVKSTHMRSFPPFLGTTTGLANQSGYRTSRMTPAASNLRGLLDDEGLLLCGLPPGLLLHGAHIWAHIEVMLDDAPGDPCQLIGLPSKYLLIRAQ